MSIQPLLKHLPEGTLPYLKKWFGNYRIHIKISRGRGSKLGDYQKMSDGSHKISVNHNLAPELFFFVLTHELAHLIAFETYRPKRISAHGMEWKSIYRDMLLESLEIYSADLKPIIQKFSKSPKANFMATPELVAYFHLEDPEDDSVFVNELSIGSQFIYKHEAYLIEKKLKKNYLCKNLVSQKQYAFRPLARVKPFIDVKKQQ